MHSFLSGLLVTIISVDLHVENSILHFHYFLFTLEAGRRIFTHFNMQDEVEPPLDDNTFEYFVTEYFVTKYQDEEDPLHEGPYKDLVQSLPRLRLRSASDEDKDCEVNSRSDNDGANRLHVPFEPRNQAVWRRHSPNKTDVMLTLLAPREEEFHKLADIDADTVSSVLNDGESVSPSRSELSPTEMFENHDYTLLNSIGEEEIHCDGEVVFPIDLGELNESNRVERSHPWTEEDDEARNYLKDAYSSCVKEELKQTIKYRRLLKGEGDIVIEDKALGVTISYDAIKKRNEQRHKNRVYAKLSRDRALEKLSMLEKMNRELRYESESLTADIIRLQERKQRLERGFRRHRARCRVGESISKHGKIKVSETETFTETVCGTSKREKSVCSDVEPFKRRKTLQSCIASHTMSLSLVV